MKNILLGLLLIAGTVNAQQVPQQKKLFKWVNENGSVIYSDKPDPNRKPTSEMKADVANPKAAEEKKEGKKDPSETLPKSKTREFTDEEKARFEKECQRAKEAVRQLSSGQRIAIQNEKNEKEFLDEAEVQKRLDEMKKSQEEACNPPKPTIDIKYEYREGEKAEEKKK